MTRPPGTIAWWQVSRTPRQAFLLGALWSLVLATALVPGLTTGEWPWYRVLQVVLTGVLVVVYVASGIARTRSRRATRP